LFADVSCPRGRAGETCLALPKLNLQFLTMHDYLLRNFNLFRLEATYEVREDINDVLARMGAYVDEDERIAFRGWARMALSTRAFNITEVGKPSVGESKPSRVTADVVVDTRGASALAPSALRLASV
jgi:intron-binding protein aquarius